MQNDEWEYYVYEQSMYSSDDQVIAKLNSLGSEGYELVQVLAYEHHLPKYYLKRKAIGAKVLDECAEELETILGEE